MSLNLKFNWNTNISEPNEFILNKGKTEGTFLIHNNSHSMPSSYQQNIFRNHYLFAWLFQTEFWELYSLCRRQNILSPQCFAKTKTWFLLPCVLLPQPAMWSQLFSCISDSLGMQKQNMHPKIPPCMAISHPSHFKLMTYVRKKNKTKKHRGDEIKRIIFNKCFIRVKSLFPICTEAFAISLKLFVIQIMICKYRKLPLILKNRCKYLMLKIPGSSVQFCLSQSLSRRSQRWTEAEYHCYREM